MNQINHRLGALLYKLVRLRKLARYFIVVLLVGASFGSLPAVAMPPKQPDAQPNGSTGANASPADRNQARQRILARSDTTIRPETALSASAVAPTGQRSGQSGMSAAAAASTPNGNLDRRNQRPSVPRTPASLVQLLGRRSDLLDAFWAKCGTIESPSMLKVWMGNLRPLAEYASLTDSEIWEVVRSLRDPSVLVSYLRSSNDKRVAWWNAYRFCDGHLEHLRDWLSTGSPALQVFAQLSDNQLDEVIGELRTPDTLTNQLLRDPSSCYWFWRAFILDPTDPLEGVRGWLRRGDGFVYACARFDNAALGRVIDNLRSPTRLAAHLADHPQNLNSTSFVYFGNRRGSLDAVRALLGQGDPFERACAGFSDAQLHETFRAVRTPETLAKLIYRDYRTLDYFCNSVQSHYASRADAVRAWLRNGSEIMQSCTDLANSELERLLPLLTTPTTMVQVLSDNPALADGFHNAFNAGGTKAVKAWMTSRGGFMRSCVERFLESDFSRVIEQLNTPNVLVRYFQASPAALDAFLEHSVVSSNEPVNREWLRRQTGVLKACANFGNHILGEVKRELGSPAALARLMRSNAQLFEEFQRFRAGDTNHQRSREWFSQRRGGFCRFVAALPDLELSEFWNSIDGSCVLTNLLVSNPWAANDFWTYYIKYGRTPNVAKDWMRQTNTPGADELTDDQLRACLDALLTPRSLAAVVNATPRDFDRFWGWYHRGQFEVDAIRRWMTAGGFPLAFSHLADDQLSVFVDLLKDPSNLTKYLRASRSILLEFAEACRQSSGHIGHVRSWLKQGVGFGYYCGCEFSNAQILQVIADLDVAWDPSDTLFDVMAEDAMLPGPSASNTDGQTGASATTSAFLPQRRQRSTLAEAFTTLDGQTNDGARATDGQTASATATLLPPRKPISALRAAFTMSFDGQTNDAARVTADRERSGTEQDSK